MNTTRPRRTCPDGLHVALRIFAWVVVFSAASGSVLAQPQSITAVATHDATLYEDSGGLAANGSGSYLFAGKTDGAVVRRGLIRFDLSAIPPGATITGVTLTMNISRGRGGTQTITLHRALASWGEGASDAAGEEGIGDVSQSGDVTWIHRFYPGTFWATPGGDFAPAVSATSSGNSGPISWSGSGLIADAQAWINDPASNFGWLIKGNESSDPTAKRFDSRTFATVSRRPTLTINYNGPAPLVGACCLPSGACVTTSSGACALQGGTFQGVGVACAPSPCPPAPTGACCLPDGSCSTLAQFQCEQQGGTYLGNGISCSPTPCPPVLMPFVDPLPIPPVAQPTSGVAGGAAHYDIEITRFQRKLHRDLPPTTLWGYEGMYPGPTILARSGQPITVTWMNNLRDAQGALLATHDLPVETCLHGPSIFGSAPVVVTHLHGGQVPADSDGYPESAFPPGQSSNLYTYPNEQRAATIWYHDHALGITRLNVLMGLAGAYVIQDAVDDALNLPRGIYDLPLIIQDRSLNRDGTFDYPAGWQEEYAGRFNLVNGVVWPYLDVHQGKYRFRVVNGSNSRTYTLSLSNGRPLSQISSDAGLLSFPFVQPSITLMPGERADLIVDFAGLNPGSVVVLRNTAPAPFPGEPTDPQDVMRFNVTSTPGDTDAVPASLTSLPPINASEALVERSFVLRKIPMQCAGGGPGAPFEMWTINDLLWDDITESPRLGTSEIWSFINRSNVSHPMHMHLVHFRVLDRQEFMVQGDEIVPTGPRLLPLSGEAGWKDTVNAPPALITRVFVRFDGSFTGLFPYHCHVLEHEDHEMMRQFRARARCPGDSNDDGTVNFADITTTLAHFGMSGPRGVVGDANLNGLVDFGDITTVLSQFGMSCN